MADVLKIRIYPDPILRKKCVSIPAVDQSIQKLIDSMMLTMQAENGAGLAAPQVGKSLRLIVVQPPEGESFTLVNPRVVKREGEREVMEACLSIPGYEGFVNRSTNVTVKGQDRNGNPVKIKADGFLAQILEHEIDHLDGILYTDHIEDKNKFYPVESEVSQVQSIASADHAGSR